MIMSLCDEPWVKLLELNFKIIKLLSKTNHIGKQYTLHSSQYYTKKQFLYSLLRKDKEN